MDSKLSVGRNPFFIREVIQAEMVEQYKYQIGRNPFFIREVIQARQPKP